MSASDTGAPMHDSVRRRAARRYRLLVVAGVAGTVILPPLLVWQVSSHPAALRWALVAGVVMGGGHALGHRDAPSTEITWLAGLHPGDVRLPRWAGAGMIASTQWFVSFLRERGRA